MNATVQAKVGRAVVKVDAEGRKRSPGEFVTLLTKPGALLGFASDYYEGSPRGARADRLLRRLLGGQASIDALIADGIRKMARQ